MHDALTGGATSCFAHFNSTLVNGMLYGDCEVDGLVGFTNKMTSLHSVGCREVPLY